MLKWFSSAALYVAAAVAIASCSSGPISNGSTRHAGGASGSAGTGSTGQSGTGGSGPSIVVPDAGDDSGSTCSTLVSCTPLGGQYCGAIGDGCNGTIDCGMSCKADWSCMDNLCVGGAGCVAGTCTAGTTQFCGTIGDGCGKGLDCGACAAGETCTNSVCVKAGCVPLTCGNAGSQFCGTVGDGCGGGLPCGACPAGQECNANNVCVPANCSKGTCTAANGGQYCGTIGDGCGGSLDCNAACPNAGVCGMDQASVCPGTGMGGGACTGIQCNIDKCTATTHTSLSGVVYDPAGINPIYNALVYVPNITELDPVPTGASCDRCSATASGQPIATALTDDKGHFQILDVPTGTNIPLVIQVGKWRREITTGINTTACVDTAITNQELTRLPKTQSEGNIPQIALVTGGSDALECELRRIGIADSEFTTDAGKGRVHMYFGGTASPPTIPTPTTSGPAGSGTNSFSAGDSFASAQTLWANEPKMEGYDMLMLSCEGSQYASAKSPYYSNMDSYLNHGGRVFFGHLHFNWLLKGPADLKSTADYIGVGSDLPPTGIVGNVNTGFAKGAALANWLDNVGATTTHAVLNIVQGQFSVDAVNPPTQDWVTVPVNPNDSKMRKSVQYLTFNTPSTALTEDAQCGRAVMTDLHMNASATDPVSMQTVGGDNSDPSKPFPTECKSNGMTPQAKALEFIFFDLSACVQPDSATPTPPPP
ncbi:MAG TPA: carboxypeptidase-like regulatory domain-containing protein, partial [Polyangiaceae bacterium]|nr:carboxypeptidase-like regulatory domain-containing protein [Polyangiaceae bacterium]